MSDIIDPQVLTALKKGEVEFEQLECDPEYADTAKYCEHYNFLPEDCANTILVAGKGDPAKIVACVVLATDRLDVNKKVRIIIGAKKASFANAEQTVRLTGMKIGGVVAFGLPSSVEILIDTKVLDRTKVIMGGGNRSSKILISTKEFDKLSNLKIVDITQ